MEIGSGDTDKSLHKRSELGSDLIVMEVDAKSIPFRRQMQSLCRVPFHGHKKGCPNYGVKEGCPPNAPLLDQILDLDKGKLFILITEFKVGEFAERMLAMHRDWQGKPRQLYNPRRWQGTARKHHAEEVAKFLQAHEGMICDRNPEAHGVDVTHMLEGVGIKLDWSWPPRHSVGNIVRQVSIAGYPKVA